MFKSTEFSALCPLPRRGTAAFSYPVPFVRGWGQGGGPTGLVPHPPSPGPAKERGRPLWVAGRFRGWAQGQRRPWASHLDLFLFNYFLFCECVCPSLPPFRAKWGFWGNLFFPLPLSCPPSVASHQPSFLTRQRAERAGRGLGWPGPGCRPSTPPSLVASIPPPHTLFKKRNALVCKPLAA